MEAVPRSGYNGRMKVLSLQSGSNGNCIYVEARGVRLLIDAGISGIEAESRLARHGCDAKKVDGLLISHDHADHARNLGIYHRRFGVPVFMTAATHEASQRFRPGRLGDLRSFTAGESIRIGTVVIETIRTPHDGADGVVFVIDDGRHRMGILTDLGHVFADLATIVASLDGVFIESNYDPARLERGSYPDWLKQRIRGPGGHLSNDESAELLRSSASNRLRWACLGHLSQDNNSATLALRAHRKRLGDGVRLMVASRHEASEVLEL